MLKEVFIVSAVRTPIGSFLGSLSAVSATKLGSVAIAHALKNASVNPEWVDEVFMGNVLQANEGQAPARQASLGAGIPYSVPCTTVNKVCASGTKSVIFGAQAIQLGEAHIIVAGGMESMSNVPFYLGDYRTGRKFGHGELTDGMIKDGLWDVYNNYHMGNAAELCARECRISREDQDKYAIESYKRSQKAWTDGKFTKSLAVVEIPQRKGDPVIVNKDEEPWKVDFAKIPALSPVFQKDGTVTAANSSTLNDGAAAVILASEEALKKYNLKPVGRILSYADAEREPEWFTTAPSLAMPKAFAKAGLDVGKLDAFEVNEAFSVVALANQRELKIPMEKINVFGGAVSLGHPLGASGCRILVTLIDVLRETGGKTGALGICNGGGGASAMVVSIA